MPRNETLEQKAARVLGEPIEIVAYDEAWPKRFEEEKARLLALPHNLIRKVEHFGSTAVPGLAAKAIVDVLVEVTDLAATRVFLAPLLEAEGCDFFWRGVHRDDEPPFYAWFIRRDTLDGRRTHHIHMVERNFPNWEALLFRDYLRAHPAVAREYVTLKLELASHFQNDREGYTDGKTEFIKAITAVANSEFGHGMTI